MALSKTQNKRLGALLSIMFNDSVPSDVLNDLIKDEYLEVVGDEFKLTEKGMDEKNRLCTLAGLNISYTSEKGKGSVTNGNSSKDRIATPPSKISG